MSYEKQTWETGDIISASKLNHMEDGIGNNSLPYEPFEITITVTDGTYTSDKSIEDYNDWIVYGQINPLCKITVIDGEYTDEYYGYPTSYSSANGAFGVAFVIYDDTSINFYNDGAGGNPTVKRSLEFYAMTGVGITHHIVEIVNEGTETS